MADIGLTVPFTPSAGTAESSWLRLVQVGADSNIATMDEAADLIDSLYRVSPCETGTEGTGGEAADDSNLPDEDTFLALSADKLGALCAAQDHWDAQVDLLRSHPTPTAWQARSATATLIRTDVVTEPKTETVTLDGANHYDLEYPYHSGLTVRGADVVDVRGSTVNFARPVTGRVRIGYTARIERLTFRVPATPDAHGQAQAEPAAIIVFWGGRAAQIDLRQPETDETVSAVELERLCRRAVSHQVVGDCWQTVEHYNHCSCRDTEAPGGWSEQTPVPCPQGVAAGTHVGTVRKMHGHVRCRDEEDEELHDPEYYKRICCEYPRSPSDLPTCRRRYQIWCGGAEIEGGAAHWRDQYGPDVRLVAVTPPDGICGQLIHEWEVNRRNCCDDVVPLSPSPDNPEHVNPGGTYLISVQDGRPGPLTWRATGGLRFVDTGGTTYVTTSRGVHVIADANICPSPRVTVDDGCYPVTLVFRGPDDTTGPALDADSLEVRPESDFAVSVSGGLAPYMWIATGTLRVLGYSPDGQTLFVRTASIDSWCVETVTVVDQCGREDSCDIYNAAAGSWREVPREEYDVCSPPGAPFALDYENATNIYSKASGGYRAVARWTSQQQWERYGGSCIYRQNPDAWFNCATGNIIVRGSATGPNRPGYCTGSSGNWRYVMVGPACCREYNVNSSTSDTYTSWWQYTMWLYRWYCGEQGNGGG